MEFSKEVPVIMSGYAAPEKYCLEPRGRVSEGVFNLLSQKRTCPEDPLKIGAS